MKIRDVTPQRFSCTEGHCPAVYATEKGTYLIVGSRVDSAENPLSSKVGLGETIIEVPVELIRQTTLNKGDKT